MTGKATALALARRGFKVFPIRAGAKFPPLVKDWPTVAHSDEARIAAWPDKDFNVGIHCAGLLVLDLDRRKDGFEESWIALDMAGSLPTTLEALTPSGGSHLFYRLPEGHPGVPNSVGREAGVLGPGIDVRSTGGYVVGAGSRTDVGEYAFRNAECPIAPAPEWLVAKLGQAAPASPAKGTRVPDAPEGVLERATAWLTTAPRSVKGQGGDDTAFRVAAFLRDMGVSEAQACELMRSEAWDHGCGWRDGWLEAKPIHSAYRYATGEPGSKAVTADDFPTVLGANADNAQNIRQNGAIRLDAFAGGAAKAADYLVKGLLYKDSYAEIYGPPGTGKTFAAMDIAYHVAAGKPWMGRKVKQGTVLYLAFEGFGGLVKRAQALRQKYGTADVPFYVHSADFNLREVAGRQALGTVLGALPEPPSLIVIDTFAHALRGGDENSAQDVSAFNSAVQALIVKTHACVLILHHPGKDASRGPRGSSALQGAVDTEIEANGRTLTPTKQKDVELGDPIGFKLVPVTVGIDDDNDPITSCVIEAAEISSQTDVKLVGNTKAGWDVLCTARPDNAPIHLEEWKDLCVPFLGTKGMRKRFYDIYSRLHRLKLIQIDTAGNVTRSME
jgi:hypothetical protein